MYWAKHKAVTTHPGPAPTRPPVVPPTARAEPVAPPAPNQPMNSKWGAQKARDDEDELDEFVSSDSDTSESWGDEGGVSDECDEGDTRHECDEGGTVMNDDEWARVASCELEEGDEWRGADIYCLKDNPDKICVYFGDDEYEGFPGGTYTFDRHNCRLYDDDMEVIEVRDVVFNNEE